MEFLRIRSVVEQYFYGVDAVDQSLIRGCFDDDAVARLHIGTSREEILRGGNVIAVRIYKGCSSFSASTHSLSNIVVDVSEASARCMINATAHVLIGGLLQVRGLKYEDEFVLRDDRWRIRERSHRAIWQYNVNAKDTELQSRV